MICATGRTFAVLQVPPRAGRSVLLPGQRGCKLGVSFGHPPRPQASKKVLALQQHLKTGDRGGTADVEVEGLRQTPRATRAGRLRVPVTFLCHQTPSPGKGGPASPQCLRGSLRHRFLSQDDVNNVTFLQHLSVRASVNIKAGEERMTFLLQAARSAPLGAQPRWCPGLGSTSPLTLSYPTVGPRVGGWDARNADDGKKIQGKQRKASYISSVACSGARILVPSFSLLQKSSSIWTPG